MNIIVVEGTDCVGKGSIIEELLKISKEESDLNIEVLREPGGTLLGEVVRGLLKTPPEGEHELSVKTQTLLFNAARSHLLDKMRSTPNTLYILDRHSMSTRIYQGFFGGETALVQDIEHAIIEPSEYILGFLIDVSDEQWEINKKSRGDDDCAIDKQYSANAKKMRGVYRGFAIEDPLPYVVIENNSTINAAATEMWAAIKKALHRESN